MNDRSRATRRFISLVVMLFVLMIIAAGVWFVVQGIANPQSAQAGPTPTALPSPTNEGGSGQTTSPGEATQPDQALASQPAGQSATQAPGEATLQGSTTDTSQSTEGAASQQATEAATDASTASTATLTQESGGGGTSPTRRPAVTKVPTTPASPTATFTPTVVPTIAVGAVGIGVGANIGSGQARVVSVTRPGTDRIVSLGGNVVPPPAKSSWVLVEMLDICSSGAGNCAPSLTSMQVVGTSGTLYPRGSGFTMDPIFGPSAYVNGQVWGYLGFVVPDSETGLWLIVTIGGKTYPFALQ